MTSVYLYPTTSCPCAECPSQKTFPITNKDSPPTNLSVRGCSIPPYFDCYSNVEISRSVQPREETSIIHELNPQAYTNKLAAGFAKYPFQDSGCKEVTWLSPDPRLVSTTRPGYYPLDRPPMDGDVRLKNIYDRKYTEYGLGSRPYKKIDDGQIVYYVDRSIQDAFYKPVYSEPATEQSVLYRDPMGSVKPEYNRIPIFNTENPTTVTTEEYPYCLAFLQDTQSHREDIMSLQQRKNNQEKWSARWTGNTGINM